jgi:hypothetical protein
MAKRVYFGFDYQDVSDFRANVVRNHNKFTGGQEAGYFDASIWEEAETKNAPAIKRLINSELENTSVTVILIGTGTYARRWVRYEIFKSIERGNKLFGIHINSITGRDEQTKLLGPNPFEWTGLQFSDDGKKGSPTVWNGQQWVFSGDMDSFPVNEQPIERRGKNHQLSKFFAVYNWVTDIGSRNFSSWIT